MSSDDPKMGAQAPGQESARPESPTDAEAAKMRAHSSDAFSDGGSVPHDPASPPEQIAYTASVDDSYGHHDDPYGYNPHAETPATTVPATKSVAPPPPPKPPAGSTDDDDDGEEGGMLRMSFLEHLEELRSRLLRALMGLGVVFVLCLTFSDRLWLFVQEPAHAALIELGKPPNLVFTSPMESFQIIWMK